MDTLTSPLRVLSVLATLAAFVVSVAFLVAVDGDALGVIERQHDLDRTPYAVAVGWLVLGPLLLVVAASYLAVSRVPWLLVCVAHVAVLVAVPLGLADVLDLDLLYWAAAAVCGAAAAASVVAATASGAAGAGDF